MPPSSQVPLQLEEFFLEKIQVEWRSPPDGEHKYLRLHLQLSYDLATKVDDEHAYQMVLTIAGEDTFEGIESAGHKFESTIVGRYRLENAKPEMEPMLARVNGVSLLYSTFRGIMASVTGNFEHGKVMLPSIDPKAVVERIEEERRSKEATRASVDGSDAPEENKAQSPERMGPEGDSPAEAGKH